MIEAVMTGQDAIAPSEPLCLPERSPAERNITLLVFLISLVYLYLFRRYTKMDPDEGIILQGAERILRGHTPYRDFFSFYTPGSFYLTAAVFNLLGDSLEAARTVLIAGASVVSALTYLLARRVCSRGVALFAAALTTFTCIPYRDLVIHNWDSTLWAMLALYTAVRHLEAPGRRRAFALGSLASLTVLFEQSKGAGLVLGLGLGFAALAIAWWRCSRDALAVGARCSGGVPTAEDRDARNPAMRTSPLQQSRTSPLQEQSAVGTPPLQHLPAMAAGFAWPFLLVFAWFAHQHALGPMLADWLWPLHHYSRANHVPYGYQNWSEASRETLFGGSGWGRRLLALMIVAPCFLMPVLPLIAAGIFVWCSYRNGSKPASTVTARTQHYLLVSATITGLLVSVVVGRADILHFVYLAPVLYLVLAWVLDGRDVPSPLFHALLPALRVLTVACFALLAVVLAVTDLGARVPIETRRGSVRSSAPDQVLNAIQAQVSGGSTILVYPYLPLYYYLSDTFAPGSHDFIQPGMHTMEQEAEVAHDLAADRTPAVLYEYAFDEKFASSWPDTPLEAIARDPVADYLLAHYHSCAVLKSPADLRFLFMVRNDSKCPVFAR